MKQYVEELHERCETKTDNEARNEVCVTMSEKVDDVQHETSEEKRKQKEESLETGRLRESTILDNQVNRKELKKRGRIFRFTVDADTSSGEGDERRVVAQRVRKRAKFQKSCFDCMFRCDENTGKTLAFFGQGKSDESCAQHGGSSEVDGRLGMSKADGRAPRSRIGVRGHHRDIGQRSGVDKLDRVTEDTESDEE